jgi:predicted RNase H-like HicB family nuclease
MNFLGRLSAVFLLTSSLLVFGCNPSPPPAPKTAPVDHDAEHDHDGEHEHHETYADAVKELDELRLVAKNALAENKVEAADKAVHELGHILAELPALADKEGVMADERVKPAIDDLFDCFDQIDQKLEGGVGKTYDEVAERIDAAMDTLRSKVKSQEK